MMIFEISLAARLAGALLLLPRELLYLFKKFDFAAP